jgi:hypothetical protein
MKRIATIIFTLSILMSCNNKQVESDEDVGKETFNIKQEIEQNRINTINQIKKNEEEWQTLSRRRSLEWLILGELNGIWIFEQRATYEKQVEKLYTYIFNFDVGNYTLRDNISYVNTKRFYNTYVYAVGTSREKKDQSDYTYSFRIKDLENMDLTELKKSNITVYLETGYLENDLYKQFRIELENDKLKSLSFQTLSSDWRELTQNGAINSGQSSTNYDNNSNTGNKDLSNNIDEFLNKEESYLEIIALAYDKARSDYFNAGKGNYAQLRNEITNDYYPKKKSELESFYLQYSSNFNNDQLKRYGKLKRSLENLFRNAFETN